MNRNDLPAPNATCEVCGRRYRRCKKCIEMKFRGIEAWREHCDSIECYQTLVFTQEDISKVTREEYDRVMAFELPENRKPIKEIADKLDMIKEALDAKENVKKEDVKLDTAKEEKSFFQSNNEHSKHFGKIQYSQSDKKKNVK